MTHFFDTLFTRYPIKTRRALEILPGLCSWTIVTSPIWGSLLLPQLMAYFILFFDVYWFYKSFSLMVTSHIASGKIKTAEKIHWITEAKKQNNFEKVSHVVVLPNYKENVTKMAESIRTIANQTLDPKKIYIVLAMEEREKEAKEKAEQLISEFKGVFGDIFASYHPDIEGEIKGKSSNQAFGGKEAYERLYKNGPLDINFATISSVDVDSIFDKQFFAYLTYKFLHDPKRYNKFWQSANVNYNNFWDVPAPVRVIAFFWIIMAHRSISTKRSAYFQLYIFFVICNAARYWLLGHRCGSRRLSYFL